MSAPRDEKAASAEILPLVHEAYMRVLQQTGVEWKNPGHLRAVCAQAMCRVLVDHARTKNAGERGGGRQAVTMQSELFGLSNAPVDVLGIEDALAKLDGLNERQARIVDLRFLGGLTNREAAEALEVSETTVEDQWRFARAWLNREHAE